MTEQSKTLEALQTAIHMEIDGKAFYLKASEESSNELGRKLLKTLAGEEDMHRQKFEQIYGLVKDKNGWPDIEFKPEGGKKLRTIFADAANEVSKFHPLSTESDDIRTAMGMENKTYDYYIKQSKVATYSAQKELYEKLAAEERGHFLVLRDYHEFLNNPVGWFVEKERPSLDGG